MANRKEALASEVKRSKSYSRDEFMGAYLRGELELKPDGKVKSVKSGRPRWLLVPTKLVDMEALGVELEDISKWIKHTKKDGSTFRVFGLMEHEWRDKGYRGKLVKRYLADIDSELSRKAVSGGNFDTEFEQAMLEWEVGEDKN